MQLSRYTPTAVLALLQEVAQLPDVKIDWNALVNKTSTGISNAREYQMLWRHLAYGHALLEKLEDGAQPLVRMPVSCIFFKHWSFSVCLNSVVITLFWVGIRNLVELHGLFMNFENILIWIVPCVVENLNLIWLFMNLENYCNLGWFLLDKEIEFGWH